MRERELVDGNAAALNLLGVALLVQSLLTAPPLATFWLTQRDPDDGGLSGPGLGALSWQGVAATALVCVLEWLLIRRERQRRARKAAPPEAGAIGLGVAPKVWYLVATSLLVFYWFGGQAWPGLAGFVAATALGWGMLVAESWQGRHRGLGAVARANSP
ncbi:MAG: hypothetical protein ABR540_08585 [Acidimicrobiales bacterium]